MSALALSCTHTKSARSVCLALAQHLRAVPAAPTAEKRLARARAYVQRRDVQRHGAILADRLARRAARPPVQASWQLDAGFAHLAAGHLGESLAAFLLAHEANPRWPDTADAIYLTLMLHWDGLDRYQQIDWAKNIAGRIVAHWPTRADLAKSTWQPRAIDIARVVHLYQLADAPDTAQYFTELGRRLYP